MDVGNSKILSSSERHYLATVIRSGGVSTHHVKILNTKRQDLHAFSELLSSRLIVIEYGRIYATAAGCVAFGPEVA